MGNPALLKTRIFLPHIYEDSNQHNEDYTGNNTKCNATNSSGRWAFLYCDCKTTIIQTNIRQCG